MPERVCGSPLRIKSKTSPARCTRFLGSTFMLIFGNMCWLEQHDAHRGLCWRNRNSANKLSAGGATTRKIPKGRSSGEDVGVGGGDSLRRGCGTRLEKLA